MPPHRTTPSPSSSAGSEEEIRKFAEKLYAKLIENFNKKDSPFALLSNDSATFSQCPGVTSANIRNVLLGGDSTGTATYEEFIKARVEYDASCVTASYSLLSFSSHHAGPQSNVFTPAKTYDVDVILEHLRQSTAIITRRIWTTKVQQKYLRNSYSPLEQQGMLCKSATRALFGLKRKERIDEEKFSLFEIKMSIHNRIALLNECIQICNVMSHSSKGCKITEAIAERAYNRIIGDPTGINRKKLDLAEATRQFPDALISAIGKYGYIDEWACAVDFNPTVFPPANKQKKHTDRPIVKKHNFIYGKNKEKTFWFVSIDNAFSEPFWDCWISAINKMRFCCGLGRKSEAYVRCSSPEDQAIFTTSGRFTYHALPITDMEEKILSLARFVMSFQRAFVERWYGNDYCVTWDVNLLHHVVGPIAAAVYSAHSDFSPLLCSLNSTESVHIHKDIHLPERDEMQVLTIHCSNAVLSDKDIGPLSIKYTYDGLSIGSATLGSRGIHIQGPGSQSPLIEHAVTTNVGPQPGIY
jgi:hypothetical protein